MRSRWRARWTRHADDLAAALAAYEAERSVEVLKIQNAARNSTEWFENVERYTALEAEQFAYSLLTRSQRISHENLRLRDRDFVERMETLVRRASAPAPPCVDACPPMFTPFTLRGVTLAESRRRVADGAVLVRRRNAGRLLPRAPGQPRARRRRARVHRNGVRLGRRAHQPRVAPACIATSTSRAWKRIVDYVHERTAAKIALQLGHAGPKGSTQLGWEDADEPIDEAGWRRRATGR